MNRKTYEELMYVRWQLVYDQWLDWLFHNEMAHCKHDLVSEDWAGPDSGGIGAQCKRCGWSFHEVLY